MSAESMASFPALRSLSGRPPPPLTRTIRANCQTSPGNYLTFDRRRQALSRRWRDRKRIFSPVETARPGRNVRDPPFDTSAAVDSMLVDIGFRFLDDAHNARLCDKRTRRANIAL